MFFSVLIGVAGPWVFPDVFNDLVKGLDYCKGRTFDTVSAAIDLAYSYYIIAGILSII